LMFLAINLELILLKFLREHSQQPRNLLFCKKIILFTKSPNSMLGLFYSKRKTLRIIKNSFLKNNT